jgi:hypothetical protein
MIIATTLGRRLELDDHRATGGCGLKHPKDIGHGKNQRRSARVKHHRPHPRPIMTYSATVIQTSNTRQATLPVNTAGVKSP